MSFIILDSVGYELEAKTLFSNMSSPPSSGRKRTINNLIKQLKADGQWNLLDVIWMFSAHDQQASRLNWKNPGTFTITEVNSPTWTKNQGYTGNASNMYLNTTWNPATNGVNFTQNSASYFLYIRTNAGTNGIVDMGQRDGSSNGNALNARNASNSGTFQINCGTTGTSISNSNSSGMIDAIRTGSGAHSGGRNGSSLGSLTASSVSLVSQAFYIMANNANGSPASYTGRNYSFAAFGSGSVNRLLITNAVEEYMDALGIGVI